MSPVDVITELEKLREQADGKDRVALEHAVKLIESLGDQVATFKRLASQRFRSSSEKVAPGQASMSFLYHLVQNAEQGKDTTPKAEEDSKDPPPPGKKRRSKVHLLPVEKVSKELPAEQLGCACGGDKHVIGFDVRRSIIFEPARLFMREEQLTKYACRGCEGCVVQAKGTPKLIEGGLASSSLLAHLVVAKVVDALPIERVGKQLARHGAELGSSTLLGWFAQAGEAVAALMPRVESDLRASRLISFDDTPMPTKNADHAKHIQKGRLWAYLGDTDRVGFCEHSLDWKGTHPARVFANFSGHIQGDGYGGANRLFGGPLTRIRVGCHDHARRKFVEALRLGDERATPVIDLYRRLYAVERMATQGQMTPDERLDLRRREAVPVWDELSACITALGSTARDKSPLGKAVIYWDNQRATLRAYLTDGHLPIANGHVERLLRTVALLRKNALFIGSPEAGPRYAALLTMAVNCALCDANPFVYFTWLFDRLAEGWPAKQAMDLMPRAWLASQKPVQERLAS